MLNVGTVSAFADLNIGKFTDNLDSIHKEGVRVASQVSQQFNQMGDSLLKNGQMMTARVTAPLIASAGLMINAFDKQAQAQAQVRQGILSTGQAAGRTEKELFKMASDLQEMSRFGDEDILQGITAQLLTFTNIAGEQFDRTQQAALDLAARLGGDLQSSAIMVGKALNDPVSNLGALGRAGIQFSDQQTNLIKSLAETGNVAEAQRIILSELEKQYGGSAKAAADAGAGGITQLWNSIGDLGEQFGELITDAIKPFIESISDSIKWVSSLDTESKKLMIQIGGIAAAIGPALIAFGMLAKAIALALSPIALKIAALSALAGGIVYVIKNAKAFSENIKYYFSLAAKEVLASVSNMLMSLAELAGKFNTNLQISLTQAAASIASLGEGIDLTNPETEFMGFSEFVKSIGDDLGSVLGILKDKFTGMFTSEDAALIKQNVTSIREPVDNIIEDFRGLDALATEWGNNDFSHRITDGLDEASNSGAEFGNTMGNALSQSIIYGQKLQSVLANVAKQLASKAIVNGLMLLTGASAIKKGGSLLGALFGGTFHTGGTVPGVGDKHIIAKGGESILTPDQMKSLGSVQRSQPTIPRGVIRREFSAALSEHTRKLGPEEVFVMSQKGRSSF